MNKLEITMKDTIEKMVSNLKEYAERNDVDISGITVENFNTYLDEQFNDGGEARCEQFGDLAIGYALQFGVFDSNAFDSKRYRCIENAIKLLMKEFAKK